MSNILNSLFVNSNKPLDEKWGPYDSIEKCLEKLKSETENEILGETLSGVRYQGLTVGIYQEDGTIKEYWFGKGIEDKHLEEKIILPTDDNNGLPDGIYLLSFNSNEGKGYMNSLLTNTKGELKLPANEFTKDNSSFKGWKFINDDKIYNYDELVTLTNNSEIMAIWDILYSLIVQSNNSSYGSVSGGGNYNSGVTVTIKATPKTGHSFVQWSDENTVNPRDIIIGDSNITLTAEFKINQYTITVQSNNNNYGTVYVGKVGKDSYIGDYNTEISINATPNPGYSFVKWNDNNTNNSRVIKITDDKKYTGTFEQNWYYTTDIDEQENYNKKLYVPTFTILPDNVTDDGFCVILLPSNITIEKMIFTDNFNGTSNMEQEDTIPKSSQNKFFTQLPDGSYEKEIDGIKYKTYVIFIGGKGFKNITLTLIKE
jgi:hypothetical protein